jgi:hypothetical protein
MSTTKSFRPVFRVSFYRLDLEGEYLVGFYDNEGQGRTQGEAWMKVHEGRDLKVKAQ